MLKWFKRFKRSEKGQGMVEYGLILALVSIVALGALGGIGGKVNDTFEQVVGAVSGGEVIPEDEEIEKIDGLVAEDYIPIATPEELDSLRKSEEQTFGKGTKWEGLYTSGLDKNYILVSDLDLDGKDNFEPIGTTDTANSFKGTFDGGGYIISNLKIDRGSEDYVGLFGRANGATFLNVGLEDVNVTGGSNTGGLVGYQRGSSVSDSYATGSVTGTGGKNTGGLVGWQQSSSTTNSYATGSVNGGNYTGGLVGYNHTSSVSNSYATGSVTGSGSYTGGLVGYQYSSSVVNSYYDKETTGQMTSVGGTGKTTVEMKDKDTYVGWDFKSIWTIENDQYPTLR